MPQTDAIVATLDAPADAVGLALVGNYVWVVGYAGDVAVSTRARTPSCITSN